jgi:hypothetical protein
MVRSSAASEIFNGKSAIYRKSKEGRYRNNFGARPKPEGGIRPNNDLNALRSGQILIFAAPISRAQHREIRTPSAVIPIA